MHVGEYSVLGLIGAGGMGEVYRARDARLNRDIAVKVLPQSLLRDAAARARFQREARAVAALNHPNIVTIHEIGEHEDQPFIAFELVAGETLKDRIARGPLPAAETIAIALPLAEGLCHAHESGVVHRDLKPRNVMVRPDGQVKILDFGLGKLVASTVPADVTTTVPTGATEAGAVLGTVGYTAPEHLTGHPIDARSDQFAFGAIVYEMLTGRRAFERETPIQTLNAIIEAEPTPLAAVAPRAPGRLVAIVNRCLQKNPDRRYATTRDLVDALRTVPESRLSGRVAAAVLAVVMLAAMAAWAPQWIERIGQRAAVSAAAGRIAVLAFDTIGDSQDGQAFAAGMAELLTTNLSGFERSSGAQLLIVPATEVRREQVSSAKDARDAFGATLVVSGSVLRSQDHVRLTVNLTNARTLQQIGGKVIEGSTSDVLALQDAAVVALADMLALPAGALGTTGTSAPGAYDFYVQGRGYLQRFEQLDSVDHAIALFRRAIERDPGFALAYAALGQAYWHKYELTKDPALVTSARAEAQRAIDRDPDNASVRVTSGILARGTGAYETAIAEFRRALALDPTHPDVYRELGRAYELRGDHEEAEATYRRAISLRKGDWSAFGALGRYLATRRRYAEALEQFTRVVELTPDNARAYSNIGGIYLYLKRHDEAAQAFQKSVSIRPTPEALSNLGYYHFDRGQFSEAARAFEESVKLAGNNYRIWGNLGSAYRRVPDGRRATAAFQKAIELATIELDVDPRRAVVLADLADFSQAIERNAAARQYASQALATSPSDTAVLFRVAIAYEGLGDRARALELLGRAVREGLPIDGIEGERSLSELRRDPGYSRIIAR